MVRIDSMSAYLSLAIADLGLSYLLFTNQQYFSVYGSVGIFALAAMALALFMLPSRPGKGSRLEGRRLGVFASLLAASIVFALYEFAIDLPAPNILQTVSVPLLLASTAAAASVLGLYYLRRSIQGLGGYRKKIAALVGIAVMAAIAYFIMYAFVQLSWHGVDELAFNYYASYLFIHGQNPYTASMEYITTKFHIFPTVMLNGTYEYAYDYPALSFLAFLFIPLLNITSFMSYIAIVIFLSLLSAYMVYERSNGNMAMLFPIAVWLVATYGLVGVVAPYLAVGIFVLLAYLERRRVLLAGALLGLGASTTQLAWFALPLLYVLILKEHGIEGMSKAVGASLLAFLLVNAYFIALSPSATIGNMFSLLGATKLPFYGTNIMQFLVPFYPVSYWYPTALSIMAILSMVVLFYFRTNEMMPLIAVMPAMIFFLSWRNISIYGLSFMPLLLAVYYARDRHERHDANAGLRAWHVTLFLVLIAALMAAVAHDEHESSRLVAINSITPVLYQSNVYGYQNGYALGALSINVSSDYDSQQNVSFYIVSRSPNLQGYILAMQLPKLPAHQSIVYNVDYRLPLVNNHTKIFVVAFNERYMASKELELTQLR
ncbi:MAG: hypothetical protein KGI00_01055 [Candidatus Micrarchaeota archaeon]|nr:hypothetical protein [Candidatus Micrarchaeota archaeon]